MHKKCRFCEYCLLFSTITILSISFYTICDEHIIQYPGSIIYAAASFTFYNFGVAITSLIRYQKLKHPIYTASKLITFATALVSMLSLQTAMFAAFGDHSAWQKQMTIWTSIGICILITSMAAFMIRKSNKILKNTLHNKLK